jgi:hypothetical protein
MRKGLMEPLAFLVRAPFEVHPGGEAGEPEQEQLWVEVVQWDDDNLVGKLVEGGTRTTEWRKGSHVEVDDSQINALAVAREGRQLDPEEMEQPRTGCAISGIRRRRCFSARATWTATLGRRTWS